jgi:hypothetical protein
MLWLLITGANSVFSISDEVWLMGHLREHADRCDMKTWKDMQGILKSFMWIALLDEEPGKSQGSTFMICLIWKSETLN